MSQKRPIFPNGLKLVIEELEALSALAGRADDNAIASLSHVLKEGTERKGFARPWRGGPLVVSDGATGKVKVRPFWGYKSPGGATLNGGTEDASGGTETIEDVNGSFYAGESIDVPTPLPTAGNLRWDLLYAIVSTTESDSALRLVKNSTTKVTSVQSVYTRKKTSITLAWVQGLSSPVATDPYPLASIPALPVPLTGNAHIPLALVQVRNSGTPATENYNIDRIANIARLLRVNPRAGAAAEHIASVAGKASLAGAQPTDAASLISLASAQGGWANSGAAIRPARFIEHSGGGVDLWVAVGPFSTTVANKTFTNTFATSPLLPVASPVGGSVLRDDRGFDWRKRVCHGSLVWGGSNVFGYGPVPGASGNPTSFTSPAARNHVQGWGQSFSQIGGFDAIIGAANHTVLCYFPSIDANGVGLTGNDLAVIVENSTGALFIVGREATADFLNGSTGWMHLHITDQFATV
jgi:hypothetical protein